MPYAKVNQNGMISFAVSLPSFTTTEHKSSHRYNTHYEDTRTGDISLNSHANWNTVVTRQRTGWTCTIISVILRSLSYGHPTQRLCTWHPVVLCKFKEKIEEVKPTTPFCVLLLLRGLFQLQRNVIIRRDKLLVQSAFVHSTSPARRSENYLSSFIKDTFNLFVCTPLSTNQMDRRKDELHKNKNSGVLLHEGQCT